MISILFCEIPAKGVEPIFKSLMPSIFRPRGHHATLNLQGMEWALSSSVSFAQDYEVLRKFIIVFQRLAIN